jgi:hypothetical protein
VTSPDERASGQDRDAAIKVVEAAFTSGRIIQADRDKRVDELRSAQSKQDIDTQVRDLQPHAAWTAPQTPIPAVTAGSTTTPYAQPGQQPWPLVNYGPGQGSTVDVSELVGKTGRRVGGIIAAVILLSVVIPIAGVIIALVSARDSFEGAFADPTDETTYLPGQAPGKGGINLHTAEGYQDLVDAVQAKTGSTMVFDITLYPRYAVVEVPVKVGTSRYQLFYWDGELTAETSKGTTSNRPIDMADVRPELFIRLLKKVRGLVDEPNSWYVLANASSGIGQVSAYASNHFSESEYVIATFDGQIVYDSTTS